MANNSKIPNMNNDLQKQKSGGLNKANNSSPSFDPKKQNQLNNGLNNLNKINQLKNGGAQAAKTQIKKKLITEGIKAAASAYGMGGVADAALKTRTGQETVDAASSAPTVTEGVREAAKVLTNKIKPILIASIAAPLLLFFIIIIMLFSKDSFSGMGDATDIYEELRQEISSVTTKNSYKTKIDGNLILATLIAYSDAQEFIDEDINAKNIDYMKRQVSKLANYQIMTKKSCAYDSSTLRRIASNDDIFSEANYNCIPGMEGVAYETSIEQGVYNDATSGSVYYWNLIDNGFIFNYYNEFMINKDDETSSENIEKIEEIINEIYLYYEMMDKLSFGSIAVCSDGITLDGVTMNFEDYIKGVVYSEFGGQNAPIEALKAYAIAARSTALANTNNCSRELNSSTNNQTYTQGYESDSNVINAVRQTSGQYMMLHGEFLSAGYSTFPSMDDDCNVTCNESYCSADLSYDFKKSLGTHTVTVPRYFDGIDVYNSNGHCVGMSKYAMLNDARNGATYDAILEKYYSSSAEIKLSGGQGLVNDGNGFLKRVERAQRDNLYYYATTTDYNNGYIAGGLEGECAWYAVKRTNEIISTMGLQNQYSYVYGGGNGQDFCYAGDYQQFEKSTNPNDPNLKPGAVISWRYGKYGHVAIVEAVYRDSNGNITSIDISEGSSSFGIYGGNALNIVGLDPVKRQRNCEGNGTGCQRVRNINMAQIKMLSGKQEFICYLKIVK